MENVMTTAKTASGFKVEVKARNHTMIVDQPQAMGGKDEGPTPLEYLFAALGGCLGNVAMIVAKQERLEVNGITVDIDGDIDLDVLMGKPSENRAGFVGLNLKIDIDAPKMSLAEKKAFVEKVESRCPISENLINNTPVNFEIL
ncbi:MAG: OsmC family protein [Chloroflexota bacterium]